MLTSKSNRSDLIKKTDHTIYEVVGRWLEEDPDDDIVEDLYAALAIMEGSPGVTPGLTRAIDGLDDDEKGLR